MPTTEALLEAIKRSYDISSLEEDEAEPYKHKYQAADVIREALGERALNGPDSAASVDAPGPVPDAPAQAASLETPPTPCQSLGIDSAAAPQDLSPVDIAVAAARIRCGLILLETDLLPDGEASVIAGLPVLETFPEAYLAWLLESYNALGALYSQRGDMQTALTWLQKAESLYQRVTGTGTRHAHLPLARYGAATVDADTKQEAPQDATVSSGSNDAAVVTGCGTQPGPQDGHGGGQQEGAARPSADAGAAAEGSAHPHPHPGDGSEPLAGSSAAQEDGGSASAATAPGETHGPADAAAQCSTEEAAGPAEAGAPEGGSSEPAAVAAAAAVAEAEAPAAGSSPAELPVVPEPLTKAAEGGAEPGAEGTGQGGEEGRSAAGQPGPEADGVEAAGGSQGSGALAGPAEQDGPAPVDAAEPAPTSAPDATQPSAAAQPSAPEATAAAAAASGGSHPAAPVQAAAPEGSCRGPIPLQEQKEEQQQQERPAEGKRSAPLVLPTSSPDAVQSQYTSTMYFLAQVYGHMKLADRSALYCAATLYRQLASGKYDLDTWVNNCLQLGGYYAKVHAYGLAMYCHAAAQAVVDRDTAAGAELGEDIAANIKLATARVYNMRLAASHSKYVDGKDLELHYPDVSYFPDYLRFSGLSVPSPDTFPWGLHALASTFEGARELLNAGMPYFKAALSYYQLDGWVTDHVGIIMDMSNMYRCLAGFEADPNRAAAMHRCRAQLLEPLSGALSPDHYPGLSRSIDLELAHVFREVSDVRELQGGQAAKVASAAASAAKYYQRFLRSFANPETGQMPDRVDPDNEPYFLMASFGLGRMMQRLRPTGAAAGDASYRAMLVAAHQHLQWTAAYVKRHGLENWTREAEAAEELSELLVEQVRLKAMAAAAAARQGR